MIRGLVGLGSAVFGTVAVVGLLLGMKGLVHGPPKAPERAATSFDVPPPAKRPPAPRPRPQPRPKPPSAAPPPIPVLAAGLGGLDLGLAGPREIELDARSLGGDAGDLVMTADAVDALPTPIQQDAVPYPPSARARGITGEVTLALQIDAAGRVADATVLRSRPDGVFDEASLRAVRSWRFRPATYDGQPVAVRVEQTLHFDLER